MCILFDDIHVHYIQLTDGAVEFPCVFTDFLPVGSVHFRVRGVEDSYYDSECIYFPLFYQFLSHVVY